MSDKACGPNCNYRKLYESSQISLSDMSAKQAGALARVGRLRASIISTVRKNFPTQSSEFERAYGMRLSDMDDELVLAFLETLIGSHHSRDAKTTLQALGQVLLTKGIIKDINKPVSWIEDVVKFDVSTQNNNVKSGSNESSSALKHPHVTTPLEVKTTPTSFEQKNNLVNIFEDGTTTPPSSEIIPEPASEHRKDDIDMVLGWEAGDPTHISIKENSTPLAELFKVEIPVSQNLDKGINTNSWSPSPIKPELATNYTSPILKERKNTKKKEIRVQATSPKNQESSTYEVLDDRLRGIFLAASTIPRPVFIKDLLSVCENYDLITKWEEESRSNVDIGLRFISPKQRHRNRGSLIVPAKDLRTSAKKHSEDWWNTAIDLYMGSKLYELAVLLHRVGDEIIAYRFTENLAVLKVNTSKGIVTLVTVMNDRLEEGSESRINLIDVIKDAGKEKIAFVAVLTTLGEEREIDRLVSTLIEINTEDDLGLTCPLVCSKSWEYADNRGSTAIQVC